jgi:hypothetical protein
MEFEPWIRGQFAAGTERPSPKLPPGRRPPASVLPTAAFQVLAAAVAVTAIAVGLFSVGNLPPLQIRGLASNGPSLAVDTWAGVPPPPADQAPGVPRPEITTALPEAVRASPQDDRGTRVVVPQSPSSQEQEQASAPPVEKSGGTTPTPSSADSSADSTASSTFTLKGGTVTASCRSGTIHVDSATPAAGFDAAVESKNGGKAIQVRFHSTSLESELEVWCSAGLVQSQIREGAS